MKQDTENKTYCNNNLSAKLEALLFLHGEPMTANKIAKFLGVKKDEVQVIAESLKQRLEQGNSGLDLISQDQSWQLVTRKEFASLAEQITKEELSEDLTPAVLETLAIIAYRGPINRIDLEHLRGVNSSFSLRKLLIRGLIKQEGDFYQTSFDLLKQLGIANCNQLPEYEKYRDL